MSKFSYGNKRIKYSRHNLYVELVDNLHDLTTYEQYLDSQSTPWAVYVVENNGKCKFGLVAQGWW